MGQLPEKQTKLWYQSSTIWLNILGLVILALQYGLHFQVIPVEYQEFALALLNLLNRFRTNSGVTLK